MVWQTTNEEKATAVKLLESGNLVLLSPEKKVVSVKGGEFVGAGKGGELTGTGAGGEVTGVKNTRDEVGVATAGVGGADTAD